MCTPSASFFHYFLSVHYLYIFYAVKPYIIIIIIGVVLWLLNSQWKMHHCDVPSSFFLEALNTFTVFAH